MKLFIELPEGSDKEQLLHLKKFLEDSHLDELEDIGLERVPAQKGEMGGGVFGTLTAVLIGVAGPFSRLAEAFTKYAASFRTELILKNEFGDELILNTKKLDTEGIHELVQKFLGKEKPKPVARVRKKPAKS